MRKNLSQQKLLEILIAEIEILQQTSKNIKEVAPEIRRQLQELKTAKIKVDLNTDKLEELLETQTGGKKKCDYSKMVFNVGGICIANLCN